MELNNFLSVIYPFVLLGLLFAVPAAIGFAVYLWVRNAKKQLDLQREIKSLLEKILALQNEKSRWLKGE